MPPGPIPPRSLMRVAVFRVTRIGAAPSVPCRAAVRRMATAPSGRTYENRGHFDLVVIGAGPSGFAAAMRALDFGKKVLLVERDKVVKDLAAGRNFADCRT